MIKRIGGSLEAEVTLFADAALTEQLTHIGDELRFVLLTSEAKVLPLADATSEAVETELASLKLVVASSTAEKCERCWHHREEVGNHRGPPNTLYSLRNKHWRWRRSSSVCVKDLCMPLTWKDSGLRWYWAAVLVFSPISYLNNGSLANFDLHESLNLLPSLISLMYVTTGRL